MLNNVLSEFKMYDQKIKIMNVTYIEETNISDLFAIKKKKRKKM